ncbi:ABC transporter ATPase [Rossellomorea aquimaris]|uniref:ABC transporter ATPase n=1 Tax=Rossellomorea aquimaris TaxID=189382 RepID=UPI001CFF0264|nr:ABC transporter ATPase [Rossellomorea aquimaris]
MLNTLPETYFELLRVPINSGRQSPPSLGGNLIVAIPLQWLIYCLTYFSAFSGTKYPGTDTLQILHLTATIIISLLSLLFGIPAIYKKYERLQYLISILVSHMLFTVPSLLWALFTIGTGDQATPASLVMLTFIILITAGLFLIITTYRFSRLLHNGAYQDRSWRGAIRGRFETGSYLPIVIAGGLSCVCVTQYFIRHFQMESLESAILIIFPLLIFYIMVFVMPEQIVILYCKFRFERFNVYQRPQNPTTDSEVGRKG